MKTKLRIVLSIGFGLALAAAWLLSISTFGALGAHAASLTVCPSGCDYSVIQDAVDAAGDGDVIKVAAGTYDDINNYSGLAQVVYINKSITIRGGYTTAFTEPPDPEANPTTLDAVGQGRVIYIEGDINPTIEGLRITGGDASVLEPILGGPVGGGGVQVYGASTTFRNNHIFENTAHEGGGLRLDRSAATLEDNTISDNTSDGSGGGLFLSYSPATLNGNTISDNTAGKPGQGGGGGGLWLDFSAATLYNNTIASNSADGTGGLIIAESDNAILVGNTVIYNTSSSDPGGGLNCRDSENVRISANTFSYNTAPFAGGLDITSCTGLLNNNLISHNTADHSGGLAACDISIEGNTITENVAVDGAGGIFLVDCTETTLKGNIISENAAGWGGGVEMGNGEYILINNMITNNHADHSAGVLVGSATVNFVHNTLASNHNTTGIGIWVNGSSTVTLTNTIIVSHPVGIEVDSGGIATIDATLWGSGTWANGTDWQGAGTINLSNSHWGNPDFVDYLAGDYHIGEFSDAIDAGVDAGVTTDIDFHPRPYQIPDIGADEYWPPGALKVIYLPLVIK
jgi:parallel beta-helix repeat protein